MTPLLRPHETVMVHPAIRGRDRRRRIRVSPPAALRLHGRRARLLVASALIGFIAAGGAGAFHYLANYWVYRGFQPARDPSFVRATGTIERIYVESSALGGRRQPVDVYLPPRYGADPARRYPVFYLLHGFPGRPEAFLRTLRAGVAEDILLARHVMRPLILVMPFGSSGTFVDKEWANGRRRGEGWETFVARDLVQAIDRRYRTIASGAGRALGGLSEGGYGALNIGLHHPGEFRVIESWSGYEWASDVKAVFDGDPRRLAWNSPLMRLSHVASSLRRAHAFVWFYSGTNDRLRFQNATFAEALARAGITHRYRLVRGGHNWAVWRGQLAPALLAAASHLAHA